MNQEIGWSQESKLLAQLIKEIRLLCKQLYVPTTTTTTTTSV